MQNVTDSQTEDPDPELVREAYARFGAAYFFSECLHRGLSTLYAVAPFESRNGITGPLIDQRLTQAYGMTLGQLVDALRPWTSAEMHARLREAKEIRNDLAHHFWFRHCHLLRSNETLHHVIKTLETTRALFDSLDEECASLVDERLRGLGVTNAAIEAALAKVATGEDVPDHATQRRLQKSETLVRIWDVPTEDGVGTLIFELEDRSLWQLADRGLGWTKHTTVNAEWTENTLTAQYFQRS